MNGRRRSLGPRPDYAHHHLRGSRSSWVAPGGSSRGWHYEVSEINYKGAVLSRDGTTNPNRTQRKAIQPPFQATIWVFVCLFSAAGAP